jgi:hypothetical protein
VIMITDYDYPKSAYSQTEEVTTTDSVR